MLQERICLNYRKTTPFRSWALPKEYDCTTGFKPGNDRQHSTTISYFVLYYKMDILIIVDMGLSHNSQKPHPRRMDLSNSCNSQNDSKKPEMMFLGLKFQKVIAASLNHPRDFSTPTVAKLSQFFLDLYQHARQEQVKDVKNNSSSQPWTVWHSPDSMEAVCKHNFDWPLHERMLPRVGILCHHH